IDTTTYLWVDLNSTKTILRNLVSNALKFTTAGGTIKLSVNISNDIAAVKVQDTGIGIPKEKLSELLHSNQYKRSWGTKGEKGLGLGLQLVKEFTELNKGILAIESDEGIGTTITVSLPLWQPQLEGVS
ncbi:MAG: ATP-binding protein, partial [Bacteroidota bacterium]